MGLRRDQPLLGAGGDILGTARSLCEVLDKLNVGRLGEGTQTDAARQTRSTDKIVSMDPPYYDNIGYADLSDFFYVWLRRSLKPVFSNLFATLAAPKAEELVATPYRHGSREAAENFFLSGMIAHFSTAVDSRAADRLRSGGVRGQRVLPAELVEDGALVRGELWQSSVRDGLAAEIRAERGLNRFRRVHRAFDRLTRQGWLCCPFPRSSSGDAMVPVLALLAVVGVRW